MKKIFLIIILFFCIELVHAQAKNEIHFLADTINISPENRILEIGHEGDGIGYTFFCQCLPPYGRGYNVSFYYLKRAGTPPETIFDHKPQHKYISWKELSELIVKGKYTLAKTYDFYITEVLPGNKYKTNKVRMTQYSEPVQ